MTAKTKKKKYRPHKWGEMREYILPSLQSIFYQVCIRNDCGVTRFEGERNAYGQYGKGGCKGK